MEEKLIIIFNNTRNALHYGCNSVMSALESIISECTQAEKGFCSAKLSGLQGRSPLWTIDEAAIESLLEAKLILVNGEGSIHHSNNRARSLSAIGPFSRKVGLPALLVNATLYENDSATNNEIAKYTLVYVRDKSSQQRLIADGINVKYAPDLTFYHNYADIQKRIVDVNVCVTDSVLAEVTKRLDAYRHQNGWAHRSIMTPAADNLTGHSDDFFNYVADLKGFDLIVTGRYHDVCFCINAKIPFVAIESNTDKISSLLMDVFGNCLRLIDLTYLDSLHIAQFDHYTDLEITQIDDFKNIAHRKFLELSNDIKHYWEMPVEAKGRKKILSEISELKRRGVKPIRLGFRCKTKIRKMKEKFNISRSKTLGQL